MSHRGRMTEVQAFGILCYIYPSGTIDDDPEWVDEMVGQMVESGMEARRYCLLHGMAYPPKSWWDEWFHNRIEANE